MSTKDTTYKSRTIKGQKVTLKVGEHYIASRPVAETTRKEFPVSIWKITDKWRKAPAMTIPGLSYEAANEFINAFNNGKTSFEGRIWK